MRSREEILNAALAIDESPREVLADHLETIAVLRGKRRSWREIAEFLTEMGVVVDHTKVFRFAKANAAKLKQLSPEGLNMGSWDQEAVPKANEYKDALQAIALTEMQRKMLGAHYNAHNRCITYTELAKAAGYDSHVVANRHYGQLGRTLGEKLNFQFVKAEERDEDFYSSALGMDNPYRSEGDQYQLVMHHELSKALDSLGWYRG